MAKDYSLITIKEAVSGFEITNTFYEAVKTADIPDIEDIISNPQEYKEYFDGKGEVHAGYLQARLFIIPGRIADALYIFGGDLNYIEAKKKYKEYGYDSMNAFFDDVKLPFGKTRCYQAMKINKRFRRNDIIGLGAKVVYLLDLPEMESSELGKVVKAIRDLTDEDAKKFIKSGDWKYYLAGEKPPADLKEISLGGSGKVREYVQIVLKEPSIKSGGDRNGKASLNFGDPVYRDASLIVIREWIKTGDFKRRLNDMINQPEYERYLKKLRKLDEVNKEKKK